MSDISPKIWKTIFLDGLLMIFIGFPCAIGGYIWQHIMAGWTWGEWFFDPDTFEKVYGKRSKD